MEKYGLFCNLLSDEHCNSLLPILLMFKLKRYNELQDYGNVMIYFDNDNVVA